MGFYAMYLSAGYNRPRISTYCWTSFMSAAACSSGVFLSGLVNFSLSWIGIGLNPFFTRFYTSRDILRFSCLFLRCAAIPFSWGVEWETLTRAVTGPLYPPFPPFSIVRAESSEGSYLLELCTQKALCCISLAALVFIFSCVIYSPIFRWEKRALDRSLMVWSWLAARLS